MCSQLQIVSSVVSHVLDYTSEQLVRLRGAYVKHRSAGLGENFVMEGVPYKQVTI
jgi:hypothetical protein